MVPIEQKDETEEDRASKLGQNHPLDSTKRHSGSSWNRVGKFEGLKGRKARYFRDLLHFCRVQNLAQMLDGKDIETSSAALGYVFI
jgi:hypothetical protein